MPIRQVWLFKFGCWAAIASAALHLFGQFFGAHIPANDTERQLLQLETTYRYALPGGSTRSLFDFMSGFGLAFALFMVTIGSTGLVVARKGAHDADLMNAVAKVLAMASTALLVISLVYFFIVPTLCIATVAFCFACASVRAPVAEEVKELDQV